MAADLNRLVDLAYSAAVEDDLWRDWTFELVDQFDSPGALFWVIDNKRLDMCENHMCFRGVDNAVLAKEYLSGPVADDPQMQRVCTVKRSEIYLDTDHVNLDDPRTRGYLDWQEARVGTRHHITVSIMLADGLEAGVSLHRSRSQGPADAPLVAQMHALFPDFARALRLGFRHAEAIQESWWDGLSGTAGEARILLGRLGTVLRANEAARRLLDRDDGLAVAGGRVACSDPKSDACVAQAISLACREDASRGSSVAVRRKGGRQAYLLSIYPLMQRRRFLAPYGAAALVCITDRSARSEGLSHQQMAMLGLTARETELARLLVNGHSLASASETMGVAYNTARVHLGALFKKTDTTRQSELMLFLERLD